MYFQSSLLIKCQFRAKMRRKNILMRLHSHILLNSWSEMTQKWRNAAEAMTLRAKAHKTWWIQHLERRAVTQSPAWRLVRCNRRAKQTDACCDVFGCSESTVCRPFERLTCLQEVELWAERCSSCTSVAATLNSRAEKHPVCLSQSWAGRGGRGRGRSGSECCLHNQIWWCCGTGHNLLHTHPLVMERTQYQRKKERAVNEKLFFYELDPSADRSFPF